MSADVEQFNGREGETATLFGRCFVSLTLRVAGFAPRHLNRSTLMRWAITVWNGWLRPSHAYQQGFKQRQTQRSHPQLRRPQRSYFAKY